MDALAGAFASRIRMRSNHPDSCGFFHYSGLWQAIMIQDSRGKIFSQGGIYHTPSPKKKPPTPSSTGTYMGTGTMVGGGRQSRDMAGRAHPASRAPARNVMPVIASQARATLATVQFAGGHQEGPSSQVVQAEKTHENEPTGRESNVAGQHWEPHEWLRSG